jgi:hypothetical protein
MRGIVAMCVVVASVTAVHAQAVQRIDITEYGIYTTQTASSVAEPGTASGRIEMVANTKLMQSTTVVPARVGVEFGFRYKIVGQATTALAGQNNATLAGQADPKVTLKYVTHIPAPGIRNPATKNVTLTNIFYQDHRVGEELYRLYRFTDSWEVVPGVWTLEIWEGDRQLVSQGYQVGAVTPAAAPKHLPKPAPRNSPPAQ